ncbi:MAG: PEP-CTERM sorting domain-containing protein [Desulfobacteraceae bacterium]|nr:PEP-CTERM sorting domain-containing protein [Desulfobacteraceae bacterium]
MKKEYFLSILLKLSVFCIVLCFSNAVNADVMSYDVSITMGNPTGFTSLNSPRNSAYASATVQLDGYPYSDDEQGISATTNPIIAATASISDTGMHSESSGSSDANGIYAMATGGVSVAGGRALGYGQLSRSWGYSPTFDETLNVTVPYTIDWTTTGTDAYARYDIWLILWDLTDGLQYEARLKEDYNTGTGSASGYLTLNNIFVKTGHNIKIKEWIGTAGGDIYLDSNYTPPNTIPEPATMLLFGLGILGLAGVNRRRK